MPNIGYTDRVVRIIVGSLLATAPFLIASPAWANPFAFWGATIAGALLVTTAAFSFCPIYAAFGIGSRPAR